MDEDIKKLLEQNLAKNEEIYQLMKRLKSYLLMNQIFGVIRLLIIVVPLVLALIFLPPLFKQFMSQWQGLAAPAGGLDEILKLYNLR